MSGPGSGFLAAAPRAWLPIAGLSVAVLAGMTTAAVGGMVGYRAVYYLAIFGLIATGGLIALTRKEPLRFVFLALLVCFPLANALVPPGRLGITVLDAVMVTLTIGLLGKNMLSPAGSGEPLFPTRSLLIAWVLVVPCVAFSRFPLISLPVVILTFGLYVFFLFTLSELRRENGLQRLVLLLSIALIVMALGLFVDYALHVNLSLRGGNLNQLTYLAGLEIYRAAGFFQDPQKSGAFLSCLITFLLVLAIRGRFRDTKIRIVVWLAIVLCLAALPTTIARSAIVSCLLVSAVALFAFNAWSAHVKVAITAVLILALMLVAQTHLGLWVDILPATIMERFQQLPEELQNRIEIWFDTWDMFADHPITGIGPGSFQSYMLETRPGVFNYYGIGLASGVPYIPDQPESGYLKILYEGGIVGSTAALLVAGDALRRALAVIADAAMDSDARTECVAALAALATFGATFVTLFTVADPRIGALLALLLAVIWHRSLERARFTLRA